MMPAESDLMAEHMALQQLGDTLRSVHSPERGVTTGAQLPAARLGVLLERLADPASLVGRAPQQVQRLLDVRVREILRAAAEVFATKGFHEATIQEIAKHAEFSAGSLYNYFENKEALFDEADKLADQIAGLSPLAVQGTKDVINYSRDNGIYPGLDYVAQKNASALISEDVAEAAVAFMEKRPPVFKGN